MAATKVARVPTASENSALSSKAEDISYPRWFGGSASCVAVIFSHPFDLSKYEKRVFCRP
jgi:dicarboxylate transporter 10